ncbi:hypothetical protein PT276_06490 [Orbaceae bacterium ESL0721]|nr:hypothetical protein [Orbaceae bacterium ESL0721]
MVTGQSVTPVGRIPSQRLCLATGIFNVNHDINRSLIYISNRYLPKIYYVTLPIPLPVGASFIKSS